MQESYIYSIGHGNKEITKFIVELQTYDISYLIDIRSSPYSKWNPQFNKAQLELELNNSNIKYIYLGDKLGGLPQDRSCYDKQGKVVYDLIKDKDFFKDGLQRLLNANEKNIRVAIMCSESKPEECHRTKLIGQELLKHQISVNHIIDKTKIKSQETVMQELTKGKGTINLFGEETDFTSKKTY